MTTSDTFEVPSGYDDLIRMYGDNYCNLYDALDTTSSKRKFLLEIFLSRIDPEIKQSISPTATALMRINNQHILRLYDVFTEIPNKIFVTHEYARNGRLIDYLDHCYDMHKHPDEDVIWKVAAIVANALTSSNLKKRNDTSEFVHGHLCPAAIFITHEGQLKLGHLEYFRLIGKTSCTLPIENTSLYAAPEAVLRKEFTSKSDAWSLGCILYELCRLDPAINLSVDDDAAKYFATDPKVTIDTARYSDELATVIRRLLIVCPEKRISISELVLHPRVSAAFKHLQDSSFIVLPHYKYVPRSTPTKLSATNSPIAGVPTKVSVSPKTSQKAQTTVVPTTTASFPIVGNLSTPTMPGPNKHAPAAVKVTPSFIPPPPPAVLLPPAPAPALLSVPAPAPATTQVPSIPVVPQTKASYLAASSSNNKSTSDSQVKSSPAVPAPTQTPVSAAVPAQVSVPAPKVQPKPPLEPTYTKLMQCVINNNMTEAVKYLDQRGQTTEEGITALMLAAERGLTDFMKILSSEIRQRVIPKQGWDIKDRWYAGASALHFAAHGNQKAVIGMLIDVEADMCTDHGYNALMVASMANSIDCVPLLVEKLSGKTVTFGREKGKTALMVAAESGHAQVCQLLLKLEGSMTLDYDNKTALMYAAENGHLAAVKILKRREVRLTLNDNGIIPGGSAMMLAVLTRNDDVVSVLVENEGGIFTSSVLPELSPYFEKDIQSLVRPFTGKNGSAETAVFSDKEAYRYKLLKNIYTIRAVSAMMLAAQLNLRDLVVKLHRREAGLRRPVDRLTAYDIISKVYINQNVHELIDPKVFNAAHPDLTVKDYHPTMQFLKLELSVTRDESLNTELILAAEANDIEAMKANLVQAGLQNNRGKTALMAAAEKGHLSCASLIINKEAKMQNSSGWTALMIASMFGKEEVAKHLVSLEIGMVTVDGWTALMGAAYSNSPELVRLLLKEEVGRATNAMYYDGAGWTALLLAAKRNNLECVKLLIQHEMTMRLPPSDGHPKGRTVLDVSGAKIKDWVISYVREHVSKK
ncbi:Ankyrin repeat protein [Giardia duodenalis]|uniref:Kinase, NEK n=2 Tax=Giardia intestinalis TaxID=5741 RepID=C6LSZ6_GIAIB|nr:Kinase, NEK [Giardia intestinalis ATCC 50581]ESU41562.1 Ankyrin repeat protein [Giardia intestinalis]